MAKVAGLAARQDRNRRHPVILPHRLLPPHLYHMGQQRKRAGELHHTRLRPHQLTALFRSQSRLAVTALDLVVLCCLVVMMRWNDYR